MKTIRVKLAAVALALAAGSTIAVIAPAAPAVADGSICVEWTWNSVHHRFCIRWD